MPSARRTRARVEPRPPSQARPHARRKNRNEARAILIRRALAGTGAGICFPGLRARGTASQPLPPRAAAGGAGGVSGARRALCRWRARGLCGNPPLLGRDPGIFGPFLDMHGLTAAWHCHRLGIDVAVSDPCDLMRRPFNYGPLWLPLAYVAPSFSDALGFGLGLLFILSLVALPPAQSLAETGLRVATTLSTTIVFALERGNPDLVISAGLLALRHHAQEPGLKRLCAAAVLVTVLLMWRAFSIIISSR